MADNFLSAINTGINLGHSIDTQKVQREQMERMALQMQMAVNDQIMQQATFAQAQQERAQQKAMYAPERKVSGVDWEEPYEATIPGGAGRQKLSAIPYGNLASDLIYSGQMKPESIHSWLPKPEQQKLVTGVDQSGNPVRMQDAPGVTPYIYKNTPAEQSKPLFQEKDMGGGIVQKMRYNKETDDWDIPFGKPFPKYKPTSISGAPLTGEEMEATAEMLATGKVTLSDLSKRGGIKQQAELLAKAKEKNPSLDPRAEQANNAAFQSAITMQQKQIGMMGSFVKNMDYQVGRVKDIANELKTFDSRIMNVPLRAWRQKIAGSPLQAKYDMYITEIENEIGKLATGSAASIAELSIGAQEKWAKIHDKNLSVADMVSLLEETAKAGKMRMKSVETQLSETQAKMRARGGSSPAQKTVVERRVSKSGKKLVKYSDGTIGEE